MKKYLLVTIPLNLIYSFFAINLLKGYINVSIKNNYNGYTDLLVLFTFVIIVTIFNGLLYKILKEKEKKILIAIPSIVFMLTTSILLFICK